MLDNIAREKTEKMIRDRKTADRYYTDNSQVYWAFCDVDEKTFTDGALSVMEKQLIAAGIGLIANCESCMEAHIRGALRAGATEQQVIEMIEAA